MKKTKVTFDQEKLQYSSDLMRALAHPLRIYNSMKIEQSITSQHLKILKNVGIVDNNKEGKFKHYQIDYDKMEKVVKAINNFTGR